MDNKSTITSVISAVILAVVAATYFYRQPEPVAVNSPKETIGIDTGRSMAASGESKSSESFATRDSSATIVKPIVFPTSANSLSSISLLPIRTPKGLLKASIAATPGAQEKGLSGRTSMPADEGKLFIFDKSGDYGFWMKDMNFPLDLIWILENKKVAGVTVNAATSSFPKTFHPPVPIMYVLEINAGQADKYGIATGTDLGF